MLWLDLSHKTPRQWAQSPLQFRLLNLYPLLVKGLKNYQNLTNKRLKNVKQSAISDHVLTCDCNINFNDFTILSKDSNNTNLRIKESLLIARDKPNLNKTFPSELFAWQNLIFV